MASPTTPIPTTPTVEDLLRVIADNGGQQTPWLVVAVGLLGVVAAVLVAARNWSHDREMRLKDSLRGELVTTLGVIADANAALREAQSSAWRIDSYVKLAGAVEEAATEEPNFDRVAGNRLLAEREDELRTIATAHGDAFARLERQSEVLALLCPEEEPLLEQMAWLVVHHQIATWFAIEMSPPIYPKAAEANGKTAGKILEERLAARLTVTEKATKRFAEEARKNVQPTPSIWSQTASTLEANAPVLPLK